MVAKNPWIIEIATRPNLVMWPNNSCHPYLHEESLRWLNELQAIGEEINETAWVEWGVMVEEDGAAVNSTKKIFIPSTTHTVGATTNKYLGMFGGNSSPCVCVDHMVDHTCLQNQFALAGLPLTSTEAAAQLRSEL